MKEKKRIILGIDPGTNITGYGVIVDDNGDFTLLDYGCIRQKKEATSQEKYMTIFDAVGLLIEAHCPDAVAVETQFVSKNAQSAIKLGMARGVVIVAAGKKGVPVFEYAPKEAKLSVVGNGSASKTQVQRMMQLLLRLKDLPEPEDAADALALAICHARRSIKLEIIA